METNKFYVEHKGKIQGPFTFQNLQHFVKTKQITPDTPIQIDDNTEWYCADEIAGLFPKSKKHTLQDEQDPAPEANPLDFQSMQSDESSKKSKKTTTSRKSYTENTSSRRKKKPSQQKTWVIGGVVLLCVALGLGLVMGKSSGVSKGKRTARASKTPAAEKSVVPKQDSPQKEKGNLYDSGENFFSQKNYKEAVTCYEEASKQGSAEAQYKLGVCYSQGLGVSVDKEKAAKYFRKAALKNNAQAQYELGMCYLNGDGVDHDRWVALDWFQKAADQGFSQAATAIQEERAKAEEEQRQLAQQAEVARQEAEHAQRKAEKKAEEERSAAERKAKNDSRPAGERMVKTVKGVEYAFRWCPAGTFMMGSPDDAIGLGNEIQHSVTLTHGFWILETEVTQAMWKSLIGNNLSSFRGDNQPVESISWYDCRMFCKYLSAEIGMKVSLPTEAQWEYACRAGTTGKFAGDCEAMCWHAENSSGHPHPVAQKQPNAWGLYDMHGNVWEWCQDWYCDFLKDSATDPTGPNNGEHRVHRGGGWLGTSTPIRDCRSASRLYSKPNYVGAHLGFRVVATDQ